MADNQTVDIEALADALRPVKVGRNGYSRMDRYRDFSRTFGTDEGKRVLAQIMDLCEGPVTLETDLNNHALLAARVWTRRSGHQIMSWTVAPPSTEIIEKEKP